MICVVGADGFGDGGRGDLGDLCACGTQLFDGFAEACGTPASKSSPLPPPKFLDDAVRRPDRSSLAWLAPALASSTKLPGSSGREVAVERVWPACFAWAGGVPGRCVDGAYLVEGGCHDDDAVTGRRSLGGLDADRYRSQCGGRRMEPPVSVPSEGCLEGGDGCCGATAGRRRWRGRSAQGLRTTPNAGAR